MSVCKRRSPEYLIIHLIVLGSCNIGKICDFPTEFLSGWCDSLQHGPDQSFQKLGLIVLHFPASISLRRQESMSNSRFGKLSICHVISSVR